MEFRNKTARFCVKRCKGPAFGRGRTETERSERNEKVSAKQYSLAADGDAADTTGLSRLVAGATTEYGANARAKVNGIDVTSSSNVFANTVAGVTFTAVKETTAPITVTVAKDSSAVKANLENFVKAYNAVNQALNQITAYDKDTQTAGLLQGDTTAVALQNTLRMAIQSVAGGSGNGGLRSL